MYNFKNLVFTIKTFVLIYSNFKSIDSSNCDVIKKNNDKIVNFDR